MALTNKLTAIADAIRNKTGKTDSLTLDQMVTEIEDISTGGSNGGVSVHRKDINFYDYDGTLLHSYTVEEAQALTELPELPTQPGLICQGWNWSLENIKAHNRAINVGATYITDDGATRIYIHLEEGRTSPMLGVCPNGTVTVDWGDNTTPDVLTGSSLYTVRWTPKHEYTTPGDYIIRLTVDGEMVFYSKDGANEKACILRNSSTADKRNTIYQNAIRSVELGTGITSISSGAFNYCSRMEAITIPDGVTHIYNMFENCYNLTFVSIPNSVTNISSYTFMSCRSLTSVAIPDSVKRIANYAFSGCYSLTSITIPDGVTKIDANTFMGCYSLTPVIIPNSVTSIGDYAFRFCYNLTSVIIPNSVTNIGTEAFYGCECLTSVSISNSVTSIGSNAFDGCYSLVSIIIPNSVTTIGTYAFYNCYGVRFYDFSTHTAVPTLSATNAFTGIAADCEIRVPAALYDEWIAATNWSAYASYIKAV